VYLKAHAGDPLRVDRMQRASEFIPRPALTLGLTVQPEVVRGMMDQRSFRGRGLVGRFLYAVPRSPLGHREPGAAPVPRAVLSAYYAGVRALLDQPSGTDQDGQPSAHVLLFDAEALEVFTDFERRLEPRLGEYGDLSHMTDWAGKLVGAVARVAALLHMADCVGLRSPWSVPIGLGCVERAVLLADYLVAHAKVAYGQMGADPAMAGARYLLGCIQRMEATTFTKRDVHRAAKARFPRVGDLDPLLETLEEHNYIRRRAEESRSVPGRKPSPSYDVNPYARRRCR
jgi:replicative DNA helicase